MYIITQCIRYGVDGGGVKTVAQNTRCYRGRRRWFMAGDSLSLMVSELIGVDPPGLYMAFPLQCIQTTSISSNL